MGNGEEYNGPTLLDFNITTLQDRGTTDLTILIAGQGTSSMTSTGYFIASGPQKNKEENTLFLYYMLDSGFQV